MCFNDQLERSVYIKKKLWNVFLLLIRKIMHGENVN